MPPDSGQVGFRLLGQFEVLVDGNEVRISGHQRTLLAMLAANAGVAVGVDQLAVALWGDRRPATYRQQLYKHICALRELIGESVLVTAASAYRLDETRVRTDVRQFEAVVAEARQLHVTNRSEEASGRFRAALSLWRGPALLDIGSPSLTAAANLLEDQKLMVVEECVEVELALGRHAEVVGELRSLAELHPYRERLVGHLMLALYRCGCQADALDVYQRLRVRMASEFGMEPSTHLNQLYESVLNQDDELDHPRDVARSAVPWELSVAPAGLPMDMLSFTGRTGELAELDRIVGSVPHNPNGLLITAVCGMAGVGKTALVVHWAHRVRHRFPDGQLYVNLHGLDQSAPANPGQVLVTFLEALGVPGERIPPGVDARVQLYRTMVDRKHILVVLDNAVDVAQIEPLLPGSSSCFVLVTSRNALTGLVALHDAKRMSIDAPAEAECVELLRRVLGEERVAAEQDAVSELVRHCGRLPLALRTAAARLAAEPRRPIADLVQALAASGLPTP